MNFLKAIAALLLLSVSACGGGGGGGGGAQSIAFTSSSSVNAPENATTSFYAATTATGGTFSISGGADAARFTITSGGALSFVSPPDFEAPTDADRNNTYLVTLSVASGGVTGSLALTVTVTDTSGALAMRRVAAGFSQPLFLTGAGDASGRAFVVEKGGQIRIITLSTGAIAASPFLNVSTTISTDGERGLLGLAFAPDYATSRRFYIFVTNPAGDIEVRRYQTLSTDPNTADPASADLILTIAHPGFNNHNGGWIGFGPDGFLYLGVGDGGGAGDPNLNGQNRNTLLGKMLRIDVRTDAFPSDPNRDYAIPTTNPFATSGGAPEVFAFGLRNPFRAGFDRQTGNLFIGDVGQAAREEVDLLRAGQDVGANFGWNILEGAAVFAGGSTAGLTAPILEYPHGAGALQGSSITGGYVYRGPVAQFRGQYVFGDFVNRRIWTVPVASVSQGTTIQNTGFNDRTLAFTPDVGTIGNVASFGEDDAGNLYVVDFDGEIFVLRELD